ncbi:MAG: alkaline phosphatase family protein [Phycisphaerae bacterium]
MATDHLIFLSVPGLRAGDIDASLTPTLHGWASSGAVAELTPSFPCVTSCVQASMWTGTPPDQHGVIANGFYHRDRRAVEFWVARNNVIEGQQIWEAIRSRGDGLTAAAWHAQNIKDAAADFIVTPAPIHEPDGTTRLWCYSKPEGLYQTLLDELGHFPLQHYWGPLSNIESTRWILQGASWLIEKHRPNFHWIYLPHLDYAGQRFGPDSDEARRSLVELDRELGEFAERVGRVRLPPSRNDNGTVYLVAGEYALTNVSGVVYPNRVLREAGLLAVEQRDGGDLPDLKRSRAMAVVDHQVAHVYVDPGESRGRADSIARAADALRGLPGVAGVHTGGNRARIGLDHPRAGDVVLVAEPSHWFAYYWWLDDDKAPPFARTVDIHRKPGYDPMELFVDPATKGISLRAELLKGSHGAPVTHGRATLGHGTRRTALVCSAASGAVEAGDVYADTDVKGMVLTLLGLA